MRLCFLLALALAVATACQRAIGEFILFDVIPTAAGFGVGTLLSKVPKAIQVGYRLINAGSTGWSAFDAYRLYQACR
jgi:hypothetical protein